ncbi:FAD-binding oxidoreductase [Streptomyces sp. NBC_00487]|uniref:FAD-binding oxidoreductase n=1 Tax=unclassified Streptomyces TaxID=2593676 RepID=UPI002DDA71E6|nr:MULTISPECIES: FAD-binding oxidoreductase [unclassified Streptomyces]WRZ01100.1 FAD-binding oxidoreductase [Streptomyces sp. NBC_00481]
MINRRGAVRLGIGAGAATALGGALSAPTAGAAPSGRRRAAGPDWNALRRHLSGDVVLPGEADYDRARKIYIGYYDRVRPQAVAYLDNTEDVRTALKFAQDHAIRPTIRSGGHSFGGYSVSDGLVLNLSRLDTVRLGTRTVHVGPAAQQVDVLQQLAPQGIAVASGICPGVCPGGFVQGGGLGWLTRQYGMACDTLVSAQVVLADGRVVRASPKEHPDLFWAMRGGGGGNFGVVTRYEMRAFDVRSMVNFQLTWPADAAQRLMAAWQNWVIDGPRELGAALGLQMTDAGSDAVDLMVYGAWLGAPDRFPAVLDSLISMAGSAPATRDIKELSYRDAMMSWYGCADLTPQQCHTVGYTPEAKLPRENFALDRNRMFSGPVPDQGLHDMLNVFYADRRPGQFRYLSLFAFGGAANDVERTAAAYVHRDTEFYTGFSVGLSDPSPTPEDEAAARAWDDKAFAVIDPLSNKESYQNFIDPALTDWKSSYYGENYERLTTVKRTYDPHRLFSFAQGIV